ncbi:MAG: transaldolase [Chloroflexi bacterium]|nr:transaldolase [Chloroflexota bacterium]MXW28672.1 transaldolase [Chloroflexota bacterium]MXX65608.1 transaldolase [Chloroflexota bacterium]MXY00224.1 transaldolase [Chloroflexota bacterium]MYB16654.1 transaldolase [Chloroflexota bacterium]
MTQNPIADLLQHGQAVWLDEISRELLDSGRLSELIAAGVRGVTSNPTIFEKAISSSSDYDADISALRGQGLEPEAVFEEVALADITRACDLFADVYSASGRSDGFVSYELPPRLADDEAASVAAARRLFAKVDRPNLMIKVPGTAAGVGAFRTLIGEGVNVNVTLLFAVPRYREIASAYVEGLEKWAASGGDLGAVSSVASFFVSRVDSAADAALGELGRPDLQGRIAIANARLAYAAYLEIFGGFRFAWLERAGARRQRCLWASTSTKNPEYSDVLYVRELIGSDTVNTLPGSTLEAWLDHGEAADTLGPGIAQARDTVAAARAAGLDLDAITDQLTAAGVKSFADSYDALLAVVAEKARQLAPAG